MSHPIADDLVERIVPPSIPEGGGCLDGPHAQVTRAAAGSPWEIDTAGHSCYPGSPRTNRRLGRTVRIADLPNGNLNQPLFMLTGPHAGQVVVHLRRSTAYRTQGGLVSNQGEHTGVLLTPKPLPEPGTRVRGTIPYDGMPAEEQREGEVVRTDRSDNTIRLGGFWWYDWEVIDAPAENAQGSRVLADPDFPEESAAVAAAKAELDRVLMVLAYESASKGSPYADPFAEVVSELGLDVPPMLETVVIRARMEAVLNTWDPGGREIDALHTSPSQDVVNVSVLTEVALTFPNTPRGQEIRETQVTDALVRLVDEQRAAGTPIRGSYRSHRVASRTLQLPEGVRS
jgi:hypothetical protein